MEEREGEERSAEADPRDWVFFAVHHCLSQWLPAVLGLHGRGQCSALKSGVNVVRLPRSLLLLENIGSGEK